MSNKKTPAFDYALHFLHSVPKTKKQMKIKLLQKGYLEKEVDETILRLENMGWIDDENYARMYIQSEIISKGKPLFRVKGKLIEKGIDKNIIDKFITKFEDDIKEGIKNKIRKDIQKLKEKGIDGYDIMTKLYSRGYSISLLKEVVNEGKE